MLICGWRLRGALLLSIMMLLAIPMGMVGASAATPNVADELSTDGPVIQSVSPVPLSVVAPGIVHLEVSATSQAPISDIQITVGSTVFDPPIAPQKEITLSVNTELSYGTFDASARVTDVHGLVATTSWTFFVGNDTGPNEWFSSDGTPKAAQINATIRSLVEAFRWHLFGQSWDGLAHSEMPTHASTVTDAAPLSTWVSSDGTFNRDYTQATLTSLVQAFRWHFWGQSWDGKAHCEIPTHILDCKNFTNAGAISPWFNADGTPIPTNITETLRSLVEAFRWHFWGISWDGKDHPEMPTHAVPGI